MSDVETVSGSRPRSTLTLNDLTRAIRDAIIEGEYAPNQRLIEADLSVAYGASRAAIRTALLELANDGLVDRVPNRGSRVRAVTLEEAVEILEVRIELEGLCAAKAAERITDDEVVEFTQLRADILNATDAGDLQRYSQLNQLLDLRIREISQHHTAVTVLDRLRAQGVRHQFRLSFRAGRASVSAPEHAAIIDAIVARRPAEAERATRDHLQSVIAALRDIP